MIPLLLFRSSYTMEPRTEPGVPDTVRVTMFVLHPGLRIRNYVCNLDGWDFHIRLSLLLLPTSLQNNVISDHSQVALLSVCQRIEARSIYYTVLRTGNETQNFWCAFFHRISGCVWVLHFHCTYLATIERHFTASWQNNCQSRNCIKSCRPYMHIKRKNLAILK